MNVLPIEKQVRVVSALTEGCSIRAIARMTGVNRNTIMSLGLRVGHGCASLHDLLMHDLHVAVIQMDEAWGFIAKKQKRISLSDPREFGDCYTWIALDANRKAILSYWVGKRSGADAHAFVTDLRARLRNRPQITSDGYTPYLDAVDYAFGGDVDYAMLQKLYAGPPEGDAAHRPRDRATRQGDDEEANDQDRGCPTSPGGVADFSQHPSGGSVDTSTGGMVGARMSSHRALQRALYRPPHPWHVRLEAWIVGWGLWIALRTLFASCRVSSFGDDIRERAFETHGGRVLGAIWHRNILYIMHVFSRYRAVIMASRSRDGERVAQTLQRFGHLTPRGSKNDGGAVALEEMTRLIAAGHPGGLALDASTGPPYVAKSGIVRLASDAGAVILPMAWWAEPCWRLHSWDMTIIPKPFSHLVFAYGDPLEVPPALSPDAVEGYRVEIERRLHRLTYQVDHWLPQRERYPDPRDIPVPDPIPLPVHPPRRPRPERPGRAQLRSS